MVSEDVLKETSARTIQYVSVRENWIYRDWQKAIGDVMLRDCVNGPRRYEIVGFGEFERMCTDGDPDTRKWLFRLSGITDQLDVRGDSARDARIQQLRDVFRALCGIILELHHINPERSPFGSNLIAKAKSVVHPISAP